MKALIRAEEWLIRKFSPYLADEEIMGYKNMVENHKKEVEE